MLIKERVLKRWGAHLVLWVVLPCVVLVVFYLVVFRVQLKRLNDAVCGLNKHVLNPMMMFLDRRHRYAAVLRHKGHRSGKEYATSVSAEPTDDGYVIPLPYGEDVDWPKIVRATGRCTIEAKDSTYTVSEPELIYRTEALKAISARAHVLGPSYGGLVAQCFAIPSG